MGGEQPYPPDSHHSARFVCKNSGVLFENQLLQIGVKSEFRQNLGVSWCLAVGGGGLLEGWVMGSISWPGWWQGWHQRSLDGTLTHPLQAECISSMATRLRCSSRASRPPWSTLETSRLISSALGLTVPHPTPVGPWEADIRVHTC